MLPLALAGEPFPIAETGAVVLLLSLAMVVVWIRLLGR
jgi:hypothetical protein